LKKLLFSLSPLNVLERGYSIVKDVESGKIIRKAKDTAPGKKLEIILAQGKLLVKVLEVEDGKPE
jgi:exodeoxyribonuclease VII large subunit